MIPLRARRLLRCETMASRHDIRSTLRADHERLEFLLNEVISAFTENDRELLAEVWTRFDAALLAHLELEEKHMIPELLQENARAARSILEEHRHIRGRLAELGAQVDLHMIRLGTARAFIDELRAHARHEDTQLYGWADEHLADKDQRAIMQSVRARPPSPPPPAPPGPTH